MAYEQHESKSSRVVVDTPTERREVVSSEAIRTPERSGISAGTVGIIVVLAVALVTILVLLLMSGQTTEPSNTDLASQPAPVPQTTIIQQPAAQPPIVVQQPAPVTQPAPVIINPSGGETSAASVDASVQLEIDKRLAEDSTLSGLGVTASVIDGKVTLIGTVQNESLKSQVERLVRAIKGVKNVDNQIIVIP